MSTSVMVWFNTLLQVNSQDPDDTRRRRLLNIMLVGAGIIGLVALVFTLVADVAGVAGDPYETSLLYIGSLVTMAGVAVMFLINRYGAGWLASLLFLLLLLAIAAFSDEPEQVVAGRSVFIFAIPILMASVLLRPYASFLIAGGGALLSAAVALSIGFVPNLPVMLGFFMVALVSWLAARSLEQALHELQTINRELDKRVVERTRDLAEALAEIQAEYNKNEAILKSIADGVIVFDNQQRAMVANPSVAELLSRPLDSILNQDVHTLMGDDVLEADRELVERALAGEEIDAPSVKFRWGAKMLSVSFAVVRSANRAIIGSVMVCRDFTREAELDRMKSALLSMSSHELRTPLNAILGYADMLVEAVYGPLTDRQRPIIERVMANTRRMLSLVNNLLDQAQIEAGKITIHFAPFKLADLMLELESVVGVLAENKGLKFISEIGADVPDQLTSDAQRLQQVLLNLTGNAIKFTRRGEVSVRMSVPDADHWAVEVKDTGPGIPPEAQAYIFEPFRQVDDPFTRETVGSGLGLSIVKQLTHLLQGEVYLDSAVGRGSTFTIILPLNPVLEQEKQP